MALIPPFGRPGDARVALDRVLYDIDAISQKKIPPDVEVYEIAGPFFFGVADSLKSILERLERPPKIFILRMRKVPVIDASGMHALLDFYFKCKKQGTCLLLSGVHPSLMEGLKKFGVVQHVGKEHIFTHIDKALNFIKNL